MNRPGVRSGSLARGLHTAWLVLAAGVIVAPLAALLLSMAGVPARDWLSLALPSGGRLLLLARTIVLSGSSAALATAVGMIGATLLWRAPPRTRTAVTWTLLAFATVPPYVHALAWSRVFGLDGWQGALWVQAAWFAPLALALALAGLDSTDPDLFDAARVHAPAWKALVAVVLPSSRPYHLASFAIAFGVASLDFTVPSLFHVDVYALDLFAELGASESSGRVVWMSLPLVAVAALFSLALARSIRTIAASPSQRFRPRPAASWPGWLVVLQGIAALTLAAWIALPLGALVLMTGSVRHGLNAISLGRNELGTTALVASIASIAGLAMALPWSRELARRGWRGNAAWALLLIPWVLPPALIGVGLIEAWNRPLLEPLLQSRLILVLAAAERFAPCAAIVLWATARQRDANLLDAMRVHQTSSWHGWLHVGLELQVTGMAAAAALVFALSSGELGASLLVAPPGHATLTMRLYNYLHAGASESVAGTCLLMWILTLCAGLIASWTIGRRRYVPDRGHA